jgi:hypothetical protein
MEESRYKLYLVAMENVRIAMRSGAEGGDSKWQTRTAVPVRGSSSRTTRS